MTPAPSSASWCEISLARIETNLRLALKLLAEKTRFCAVLKADAYGHGIANVVPILKSCGITHVGITSNAEAEAVRNAGFDGTLMRLRTATFDEAAHALQLCIEEQVSTVEAASGFTDLMARSNRRIGLHLSLNAGGMSRDGLELTMEDGQSACRKILELVGSQIIGICTHFPSNAPEDLQNSIPRFRQDVDWVLQNSGLQRNGVLVHAGSSLTLVSGQQTNTDMMRCGAILYGIAKPELGFETTMSLKARVTSVGRFPKGSTIGYDRAMCLDEDKRLANISLGYSNGYVRQFSGRAQVLIRGKLLPVLGKISMNTIVVDVSRVPEVAVGDEVVAFGAQGDTAITVKMIEAQSGTIMADLYTDWGHRNPRYL